MRITSIKVFFVILMLEMSMQSVASVILKVDFDNIVISSEVVFQGVAISRIVRTLPNGQPMTFITFRIDDLIKGSYASPTIELGFLGGTIGGQTLVISDLKMPQQGEEGVYFVESTSRRLVNPLYGWNQGHYLVKTDENGNKIAKKLVSDAEYSPNKKSSKLVNYQKNQDTPNNLNDFKLKVNNILNR